MKMAQKIGLGARPRLVNCGLAEHGLRGREEYELPKLWCLHLYFYEVDLYAGGHAFRIIPGTLTLIPPATRIVYKYRSKRCRHFFVHFAAGSKGPLIRMPLMQHVPDGQDEIFDRLQNIQRMLTENPFHAEVLFWGLLWDVAESGRTCYSPKKNRTSSLLRTVDACVDEHLPTRTTVAQISAHVGLSATHLNRLIKASHGMTIVQLLNKRRLQRAHRLLLHSTMPVKLVAAECGIADLQQFNKLMRNSYGQSPRKVREGLSESRNPTKVINRK